MQPRAGALFGDGARHEALRREPRESPVKWLTTARRSERFSASRCSGEPPVAQADAQAATLSAAQSYAALNAPLVSAGMLQKAGSRRAQTQTPQKVIQRPRPRPPSIFQFCRKGSHLVRRNAAAQRPEPQRECRAEARRWSVSRIGAGGGELRRGRREARSRGTVFMLPRATRGRWEKATAARTPVTVGGAGRR